MELITGLLLIWLSINLPFIIIALIGFLFNRTRVIMKRGFLPHTFIDALFFPYLLFCYLIRER